MMILLFIILTLTVFIIAMIIYIIRITRIMSHKKLIASQISNSNIEQVIDIIKENNLILVNQEQSRQQDLLQKRELLEETQKSLSKLLEESRNLENNLRQERDRAQAIITSMGEGLLVINKDYEITLINPAAEKLLETTAAEAIGKKWADFVSTYVGEQKSDFSERSVVKVLATGKTKFTAIDDNHLYLTRSGRMFPVASITAPLYSNGIIGAVKVFRDVTAERASKEEVARQVRERTRDLQYEHARLSASINSLKIGFLLIENGEKIMLSNTAVKEILNLKNVPHDLKEIENSIGSGFDLHIRHEQCRKTKKVIDIKEVNVGSKFLHIYMAPIILFQNSRESHIGTVILIEDITEVKVMERSKDEFFSIASHELRTPLTAIRGNTSLIKEYYSDKINQYQDLSEMIDDIHTSSVRLIEIVNDFLDTSRLEQGRMEFKKTQVDLVKLVREVLLELTGIVGDKPLILDFHPPKNFPKFISDADKVKQVLINLINNAIKFTEKGSVTISLKNDAKNIEVLVSDTGRGIPLSNQSLLFRRFQQAGSSLITRDTTKGTGLGLYISKQIIVSLGGQIRLLSSEPGKGSIFSFTLPLAI